MPATYKVTRAKNAGTKPNPHGGELVKWYVGLKNETEDHPDVYWQRKAGSEVNVGDEVYGTVSEGEFGFRFKLEPQQQNGAGFQGGGGGGSKDDYWRAKDQRDIQGVARMGRAHAQEMALRFIEYAHRTDTHPADMLVPEGIDAPENTLGCVRALTDWFQRDVDNAVDADVGGGQPGRSAPAPGPAADVSAAPMSDKQSDFFNRLLTDKGCDADDAQVVRAWAAETLTGGQNGSASKAIDLLMAEPEGAIHRFTEAAKGWAAERPATPPPDERDLPEPEGGSDLAGVGTLTDDSDIPF